ncbi:MAG: hypothetical protein ACE5HX_11970, partial [bacterium]
MPPIEVHYLGHPPRQIRSGGDRYIHDVLGYLFKHAEVRIWDPATDGKFGQEVPFRLSFRALRAAWHWTL